MLWFGLSLGTVFASASAELLQQYLLTKKDSPLSEWVSLTLLYFIQAFIALICIIIGGLTHELSTVFKSQTLWGLIAVIFVGAAGNIFYIKSLKAKNISFSTLFVSSSAIISTILGIIFLKEGTSTPKFVGIIFILSALIIVNLKNVSIERNNYFGLLAGLAFGITYTLDKTSTATIHPLVYLFWVFLCAGIVIACFSHKNIIQSVSDRQLISFTSIIISASCYFIYNIFTFIAYRVGGEVGKVDAINNSQVFLIILFELFILKHRNDTQKKVISALIAYMGVCILGFTQ